MKPILVCGLEHLIAKTARHYHMLSNILGTDVIIYSRDISNLSTKFAINYGLTWYKVPIGKYADIKTFTLLIRKYKPIHIEIYHDTQSDLVHVGYLLVAIAHHIPVVVFCRGGELYYWDRHTIRKKIGIWLGLKLSKLVLYKEIFMLQKLKKLNIKPDKIVFFYNRIPVLQQEPPDVSHRLGVLYLNTFKPFRHPDIVVEVATRIAKQFPSVCFTIAGDRYFKNGHISLPQLEKTVNEKGLVNRISFLGWVTEPEVLYRTHCIFLLPAEHVFLNYSLLEAMERGLVPVVATSPGAEIIIEHGKDGMIVDLDADAFTTAVSYLLSHPNVLSQMAKNAREKVKSCFDLRLGLQGLVRVYQQKVWKKK
ncbi:MAG: glycosyltransferase family 4 protein [candidate division WOR-3 bacterium]